MKYFVIFLVLAGFAVFATVGIVQVTTSTYFTPLGEQRHHYFVGVYPIHLSEEQVFMKIYLTEQKI